MEYSDIFDLSLMNTDEKISFLRKNTHYLVAKTVFDSLNQILELKNIDTLQLLQSHEDENIFSFDIVFPYDPDSGYHPNNILEELNLPEIEDITFSSFMKKDFTFKKNMTFNKFLSYLNI